MHRVFPTLLYHDHETPRFLVSATAYNRIGGVCVVLAEVGELAITVREDSQSPYELVLVGASRHAVSLAIPPHKISLRTMRGYGRGYGRS